MMTVDFKTTNSVFVSYDPWKKKLKKKMKMKIKMKMEWTQLGLGLTESPNSVRSRRNQVYNIFANSLIFFNQVHNIFANSTLGCKLCI